MTDYFNFDDFFLFLFCSSPMSKPKIDLQLYCKSNNPAIPGLFGVPRRLIPIGRANGH